MQFTTVQALCNTYEAWLLKEKRRLQAYLVGGLVQNLTVRLLFMGKLINANLSVQPRTPCLPVISGRKKAHHDEWAGKNRYHVGTEYKGWTRRTRRVDIKS